MPEINMLSLGTAQIRPVSSEDLPSVSELEELCFKDPYPPYFLAQLAQTNPRTFLVAVVEEKIVGYAVVDAWSDHNHLVSIAVSPTRRRTGIGQRLLDELEDRLDDRPLELEVRKGNDVALQFYVKNGFQQTGSIHSYYRDGEDAVLMGKKLSDRNSADKKPEILAQA